MVTVTKKHQTSLALIAVVFASAMIIGTFASAGDNMIFATHGKKAKVVQSISESCAQTQSASVSTRGNLSSATASGINAGLCLNDNSGGNAANVDQSSP